MYGRMGIVSDVRWVWVWLGLLGAMEGFRRDWIAGIPTKGHENDELYVYWSKIMAALLFSSMPASATGWAVMFI